MTRTKLNLKESDRTIFAKVVVVALFCLGCSTIASAAQQKSFSSPEEASNALFRATQNNDEKAMLNILGAESKQIVSSGDEAEDAHGRAGFVQRYEQMHRLVKEPDDTVVLYIGAENWPTPIPLVKRGGSWYFDTAAGKKEILYRRVGRNEVSTIRVCQELVSAEKEYYSAHQNEYARKIFSDAGQHNGLYWEAVAGSPESPIGPLVAAAVSEGYSGTPTVTPTPYRGYYYRVLTAQGKHAPGGAKSYIIDGKMTQGFAFVAYPAEYRSSGVMTFIVNQDGVVYEKDLGNNTENIAKAIKEYDPAGWQQTEMPQEEVAGAQTTK